MAERTKGQCAEPSKKTGINAIAVSHISFKDYMLRIVKYALPRCHTEKEIASLLLVAMVYVHRFIVARDTTVTYYNFHRLFATAYLIACKMHCDYYYNNSFSAKVFGLPMRELNMLEVDFLFSVRFQLAVTPEDFSHYRDAAYHKQEQLRDYPSFSLSELGGRSTERLFPRRKKGRPVPADLETISEIDLNM